MRLDRMPLRACLELAPIANQGLMNLALLFVAYLARQTRKKKLSQNHNSLIFMTNPLQTCSNTCEETDGISLPVLAALSRVKNLKPETLNRPLPRQPYNHLAIQPSYPLLPYSSFTTSPFSKPDPLTIEQAAALPSPTLLSVTRMAPISWSMLPNSRPVSGSTRAWPLR